MVALSNADLAMIPVEAELLLPTPGEIVKDLSARLRILGHLGKVTERATVTICSAGKAVA